MPTDLIESQFSRENGLEMFIKQIINSRTVENLTMLRQFSNFRDKRPIPHNITWELMKKSYGWGYAKGSRIHSLVTWIYIRPDIKSAINNEIISIGDVFRHLLLNEHYFIVENTAINYLKSHCLRVFDAPTASDSEEADDDTEVCYIIIFNSII
jgi:hypothetical protein